MFKFTPKIHDSVKSIIENKDFLFNIADCYGSPCNILIPENIDENIKDFQSVFKKNSIIGKIFYAHKCNKSKAIMKQILKNDICIDVASYNELQDALVCGFTGNKIEATGPKNDDFIILGLQHNIIFNVDNQSELETIAKYYKILGIKKSIRILIRLNNFQSMETKIVNKISRFGIPISHFENVLDYIARYGNIFNLIGISFHLDTVNITEKVIAIENCIELFEKMFEKGVEPYVLDIGGGFKLNYIESKSEWNESISELKEDIVSGKSSLSWNSKTFGLNVRNNTLHGTLNIYNYYDELVKEKFLDAILQTRLAKYQNRTIAEILSENMIELYIEPGRSLLDNVGFNIAKINFAKVDAKGNTLVGVDMKRSDLLIGEQEMFVDPILVSQKETHIKDDSGVFFIGNLCMENDMIFNRKVFLETIPQKDDLIVFMNTAGYFMDFEQSPTLGQNIAKKVVLSRTIDKKYKQYTDENFNPFKE